MKVELTVERLREVLDYSPESGQFIWLISSSPNCKPGQVAGTTTARGYRQIRVDGTTYLAHRLAWLHATGAWPQEHIDHINGITADNRLVNLRDVSRFVNAQNAKKGEQKFKIRHPRCEPPRETLGRQDSSGRRRRFSWLVCYCRGCRRGVPVLQKTAPRRLHYLAFSES